MTVTSIVRRTSRNCGRSAARASSFPELAKLPQDAYAALVGDEVDYVLLEQIKGRIAATLALIYPPGIGVIVPGERWDERAQPMLEYFLAFEESFNRFLASTTKFKASTKEQVDGRTAPHLRNSRADRLHPGVAGVSLWLPNSEEDEPDATRAFNRLRQHDGLGHHHAADEHGSGRRDLAAVLGRHRRRLDGDRIRLRTGRHVQSTSRRHGRRTPRMRTARTATSSLLPLLSIARRSATLQSRFPPSAISRASSRGCPRHPWRHAWASSRCCGSRRSRTSAGRASPDASGRSRCGASSSRSASSLVGWFWFKSDTFAAAAWNPQGLSLMQGMGSSISAHAVGVSRHGVRRAKFRGRREPGATCRSRVCSAPWARRSSTFRRRPSFKASCRTRSWPIRPDPPARVRPHVQPDGRLDHHGARRDRVLRLAARLALHDRADRQVCRRRARMFPAFFSKTNRLGAPDRGA